MADDRDDLFGDAYGAGRSDDPDRWPANEEGPQGRIDSPPTGKSSTVKILLIVLAILVFVGILCCGAFYWVIVRNFEQTSDPEVVRERTQEIITIAIPEDFTPAAAVRFNWFNVLTFSMAIYTAPGDGMLTFTNIQGQGANDPQAQQQIDAQLRQQGQFHQINITDTETRTVQIEGEEVEFAFATGTEAKTGDEWKEVSGTFGGKNGLVNIKLQQPSTNFDEEVVVEMLESIETQ